MSHLRWVTAFLAACAISATTLGLDIAPAAAAGPANTYSVGAGGDHDWGPTTGAAGATSSNPEQIEGVMADGRGKAAYVAQSGPGVVRAHQSGVFDNPGGLTLRFSPGLTASAGTYLTITGPTTAVGGSLNLHVDGQLRTDCNNTCGLNLTLSVGLPSQNIVTYVTRANGPEANPLGLTVEPVDGGYRVHGDVETPPVSWPVGAPFLVSISLGVKYGELGDGFDTTTTWDGRLEASFSPTGPVMNLPAGYTVSGENVVDNVWTDPLPAPASVSGSVVYDVDGDGSRDVGERGLDVVTVYLDADGSGTLDSGEASTETAGGNYTFLGLPAGDHTIAYDTADLPADFVNNGSNPLTVALAVGEHATSRNFFTEHPTPVVVADYRFDDSLTSAVGTPPALADIGPGTNAFVDDTVDAVDRRVLSFPAGNGVALTPVTGVIPSDRYTIVMLARLAPAEFAAKLIDFDGGAEFFGNGLWLMDGRLAFFGGGCADTGAAAIAPNTWVQIALTRDGDGRVTTSVDGVQHYSCDDTGVFGGGGIVGAGNRVQFFRGNENDFHASGAVARIRLFDNAMTPEELAQVDRVAPEPPLDPCDATWALGGGTFSNTQFGDPASWQNGSTPGPDDTICFPTGSVTLVSINRTVEAIRVADGAHVRIAASVLNFTAATELDGVEFSDNSTIDAAGDLTIPAGGQAFGTRGGATITTTTGARIVIDGEFTTESGMYFHADVVNNGSFTLTGDGDSNFIQVTAGHTFTNNGLFRGTRFAIFNVDARVHNTATGTFEITGGTSGADHPVISGGTFDNDGLVRIVSGDASFLATGISTGTWEVGPAAGSSCAAPLGQMPTPVASLILRPSPSLSFTDGAVTGPGCLMAFGASVTFDAGVPVTVGALESLALVTLHGDRTLPQLRIENGGIVNVTGTATATGPISPLSDMLGGMRLGGSGTLIVPAGIPLSQTVGGLQVEGGLHLDLGGPVNLEGSVTMTGGSTVVNRGTWTQTSTCCGGILGIGDGSFENLGTFIARPNGQQFTMSASSAANTFSNRGTLRVEAGTFAQNVRIPELDDGLMRLGRIEVGTGVDWYGFRRLSVLAGTISVEGTGRVRESFFDSGSSLADLATIEIDGGLELRDGSALTISGAGITNRGRIVMTGPAALTMNNFAQAPTGVLAVEVGEASGLITASEAELGGTLELSPAPGQKAAIAGRSVVTASSLAGQFATVTAKDFGPVSVTYSGGSAQFDYDPVGDDEPPRLVLSVADVTVTEQHTVTLELLVAPTVPGSSGSVVLPVELAEVTATAGEDYFPANGTDGSITVPAAGGTVFAFVLIGGGDEFEVTEFFDVRFGRPDVPGEQVTARVTILDDDPFPTVTLTSTTPYGEDAGRVSLNLRLDKAAGSPLGFRIDSHDTDGAGAQSETDFHLITRSLTIPAGATEGSFVLLDILDDVDSAEPDRESFFLVASRLDEVVALEQVEIIDNDAGPQVRFVRQPADDADDPFERDLVEGNTTNPTLPLVVEALGGPITEPFEVTVLVTTTFAEDETDFTVSPRTLTFLPGGGPQTVTFTSLHDVELEPDEQVLLTLQTPYPTPGGPVPRVDDEALVTIVDDDQSLTLTPSVSSPVGEGDGPVVVTITADHAPGEFVTIPVVIEAMSAVAVEDWLLTDVPASVTLGPTDTSVSFSVRLVDDDQPEPDEQFRIVLGPSNQGRIVPPNVVVTIVDDDPAPFTLLLEDVSVFEDNVAMLDLQVIPTTPSTGSFVLPVSLVDGTAIRGEDYFPANGTDRFVTVPGAGGTVHLFVLIADEDTFEETESFTVVVGRPLAGERVTATVTIFDHDEPPAVAIVANSPYAESVGTVSLVLRLDRVADAPLTFLVHSADRTATAPEDFVAFTQAVTIPAGHTEGPFVHLTINNDTQAYEEEQEFLSVIVQRDGDVVAETEVSIIDDDVFPQARLVRQPADVASVPLVRNVVEGNTTNPTLPLLVEVVGGAIPAGGVTVTLTADSVSATHDVDFTLVPVPLVFMPGDGPKTVTFTSIGDVEIEGDDLVLVGLSTDLGELIGRIDDEAHITIVDDDDETPAGDEVEEFRSGWDELLAALQAWLEQFDLAPASEPAVVTPHLAEHFGLAERSDDLDLERPDPANDDLGDLCADLIAKGFTVDFVAGGLCGQPAGPAPSDVIRARATTTLGDLVKAAGFSADPFNDDTDGLLENLASALGLHSTGGWVGDLTVTLVGGVDGGGFYVGGETNVRLDVEGTVGIDGTGTVAGTPVDVRGNASATLHISLAPALARQRNVAAALVPDIDGAATVDLDLASGPLDLTWSGEWSMTEAGVTLDEQRVEGSLVVPGLTDDETPASLEVVGVEQAGTWHLTANGRVGSSYLLAGFAVDSLAMTADIGPSALAGSGGAELRAPVPGLDGGQPIALEFSFDRDSLTVDGTATRPSLNVGDPRLLALVDPFVHAHFDAALPGGPLAGSVDVGAATAIVLPDDPVGTATGVAGALTSAGALTLVAETVAVDLGDGALEIELTDVSFGIGPGTGPNLFEVASAVGTLPALDDLAVTFTGLFITKAGAIGASSIAVDSDGLAQTIGLGGVLPFDVQDITIVFLDPNDLDRFDVSVVGRFDFSQFPTIDGFTPRIGLGGDVVTPETPEDQNRFTFAVAVDDLANGIVRPLDVGPLTVGFDGLPAGEYTVGAELTLGGYQDGEFVPEIGGSLDVDGPATSVVSGLHVELDGTLTPGDSSVTGLAVLDVEGTATLSGSLAPGVTVTGLTLRAGATLTFGTATSSSGDLTIEPRLRGADVGEVVFPFGGFFTLRATDVDVDLDPPPGGNVLAVRDEGGVSVEFGEEFDELAGWGGTAHNVALSDDFVPRLLPNFGFDLDVPPGERFGLPGFLPLQLTEFGITFPDILTDPPASGIALTPALFDGMRVRVSGGLAATDVWPISATIDGLEVDLGRLTDGSGDFPITNFDGFKLGVEPFEMPGGVTIGGFLELRTIDVDGATVFYGRIAGEFSVDGIGGGADLLVTEFGPVLMKVQAPLGIPLGPTGIVLASAEGAAQFGGDGIDVPPVGDPLALLNNLTLPTDLVITDTVIRNAVRPVLSTRQYTWDRGFALSLAGDLIVAAAPGVLSGRATIGMNLGLPTGPSDPPGLQLVGKGEITVYGMSLGQLGMLIDFTDPVEPSVDLAFASPLPGSPLALIVPASATFGVQLRTDGVLLGTIEGLRVFVDRVRTGGLVTGQGLFTSVFGELAAHLDAVRDRPLARLLLDVDGDGVTSTTESARVITVPFVFDRVLGRNGLPPLLPVTVDQSAFDGIASAATAILEELLLVTGRVADGFLAADALASLTGVIRDATAAALTEFGERFNPTFSLEGALKPTLLGLPLGSPIAAAQLLIDRSGLFLSMEGSLVELGQTGMFAAFPAIVPLMNAAISAATLGVSDNFQIGARLPFGGIVDSLLGGGHLPTFQPLDPNWAVTFTGSLSILGFEAVEVSGMAFLPGQETFLESRIQKLYAPPLGAVIEEDLIPITSEPHFESLVTYGGILITGSLRVPRLVTDPVAQLAAFPPPPENPLDYLAWLDDVASTATQTDTPARVQLFVPGMLNVRDEDDALAWASSVFFEGVWDGDVLGLDLGQAIMSVTPAGLEVRGTSPLAGVNGTVTVNTALLDSGRGLPTAGVEIGLDSSDLDGTLQRAGIPEAFTVPAGATGTFRAYTPGFDRQSADPVRRNGGIELAATLNLPGFVDGAAFRFAFTPRTGGFDVHGHASVASIGPIAGITISNASLDVNVVGGDVTVRVRGSANLFGAVATVDGVLGPDLTGSLTFVATSGSLDLGGLAISGTAVLTLTRVSGQLRGSLGVLGTARLPAWLAAAVGSPTLAAAACADTAGNLEARLALPALVVGPGGLVRIGRRAGQQPLPASPVGCTVPAGSPAQTASGPLFAFRVVGGRASAVLDGSLSFLADNAAVAGLSVRGALDGTDGTGTLAVTFAGGSIDLGGFTVVGSASLIVGTKVGQPTVAIDVSGTLSVPGLLSKATVSGSGDENGISHLSIAVAGLTMPVVTVDAASLALDRLAGSSRYQVSAALQVDVPGVADNLSVVGSFTANGNGSLAIGVTSLSVRGAQITQGNFSLVKSGSAIALRASGRFTLFGLSLKVVQADLALTPTTISGNLVIRPAGSGALVLGGWQVGGTLRLAFSGSGVTIELDNGTLAIPGWGAVDIDGSLAVPALNGSAFTASLPNGGLRLGGAASPFFATGTFRLVFTNNVATFSVTNGGLAWKDGNTTVASVTVPLLAVSTNGAVTANLNSFSATVGSFSLTVPSLSILLDPEGLNARLVLGAGSVTIPGLPPLATPGFVIASTGLPAVTLAASNIDLGIFRLVGKLVLRRSGGVFTLSVEGVGSSPAVFSFEGLIDVNIQDFAIASNGSFAVDVSVPRIGGDIGIVNARLQASRTAGVNGLFTGTLTGGRLLVGTADPILLPTLTFTTSTRFDRVVDVPEVDLGPFFHMNATALRVRHLSTGIVRAELVNPVTVNVFDGSGTLTMNDLLMETDGTFSGSVTGGLALFGTQITSATFTLARQAGVIELRLGSGDGETLNLGFLEMSISGEARSNGTFSFTGSSATLVGVTGFSISGSLSVAVANTGISGSFAGSVCIVACASTSGTLRSDGRVSGTLVIPNVVNATWRLYLATGGIQVDINSDGDYQDVGDVVVGVGSNVDSSPPTMTQPANITVQANIDRNDVVRVYYDMPVATDNGFDLPVQCTPASGSLFEVRTTTVTCQATDRAGNVRQRTFTVTVTTSAAAVVPVVTGGATVLVEAEGFQPNSARRR